MMEREEKIVFTCCTEPRLYKLQEQLPVVLPFVDKAVIILGREDEETRKYLESLGKKVEVYLYPWKDDFALQWNNFLLYIEEGDWTLNCDDDEIPSEGMLKSLDYLVKASEKGNRFCFVEFRCHNISEGQMADKPADYWRQLFYRYNKNMHYEGGPVSGCHQYVVGHQNGRGVRSNELYYHSKSLKEENKNAARNFWIYGVWPSGAKEGERREEWYELHEIVNRVYPTVKTFQALDDFFIAGNIHEDLKEVLVRRFKEFETSPDHNELRAIFNYYFTYLHPEEAEQHA